MMSSSPCSARHTRHQINAGHSLFFCSRWHSQSSRPLYAASLQTVRRITVALAHACMRSRSQAQCVSVLYKPVPLPCSYLKLLLCGLGKIPPSSKTLFAPPPLHTTPDYNAIKYTMMLQVSRLQEAPKPTRPKIRNRKISCVVEHAARLLSSHSLTTPGHVQRSLPRDHRHCSGT